MALIRSQVPLCPGIHTVDEMHSLQRTDVAGKSKVSRHGRGSQTYCTVSMPQDPDASSAWSMILIVLLPLSSCGLLFR